MREVIPFVVLIHIPKPKVFFKLFKYNQSCIAVADSKKLSPGTKISILNIIISKALCKGRLFGYVILIHENKQWTFSLSKYTKHYLSIYETNLSGW